MKEYITVSQLSQIFGMQRVDSSSSSSLPSFQLASSETTFSCQSTACGPYTILSAQVCSRTTTQFQFPRSYVNFLCCACFMLVTDSLAGCHSSPQSQPELRRNAMPPINLERWYQDIMAAGEPQSCPPPLPAKSFSTRRQGKVNPPLSPPFPPPKLP